MTLAPWPRVTIVFLVHNRREELRESLRRMLEESDYDPERVHVVVVDNASTDGSAGMVREDFPEVELIVRDRNVGVSGWNDGLAAAGGDYVLALDDDCYLPPDGLSRAIAAAQEHQADLVSFKVVSTRDPEHVFTDSYPLGLFAFWGCAVLMRRAVIETLGGYDPKIFVWANELEFMVRFFDHGFRHLYLPDVAAQHMKPLPTEQDPVDWRAYRFNARHFGYVASKLLLRRDAFRVLVSLLTRNVLDGLAISPQAFRGLPHTIVGFLSGLRHSEPVRNPEVSHCYRADFETFASPWKLALPPREMARALPRELAGRIRRGKRVSLLGGRRAEFYERRARFYPTERRVLRF
jgi:GT2 family glycosyltransferase